MTSFLQYLAVAAALTFGICGSGVAAICALGFLIAGLWPLSIACVVVVALIVAVTMWVCEKVTL